jgi:hypothetical protein
MPSVSSVSLPALLRRLLESPTAVSTSLAVVFAGAALLAVVFCMRARFCMSRRKGADDSLGSSGTQPPSSRWLRLPDHMDGSDDDRPMELEPGRRARAKPLARLSTGKPPVRTPALRTPSPPKPRTSPTADAGSSVKAERRPPPMAAKAAIPGPSTPSRSLIAATYNTARSLGRTLAAQPRLFAKPSSREPGLVTCSRDGTTTWTPRAAPSSPTRMDDSHAPLPPPSVQHAIVGAPPSPTLTKFFSPRAAVPTLRTAPTRHVADAAWWDTWLAAGGARPDHPNQSEGQIDRFHVSFVLTERTEQQVPLRPSAVDAVRFIAHSADVHLGAPLEKWALPWVKHAMHVGPSAGGEGGACVFACDSASARDVLGLARAGERGRGEPEVVILVPRELNPGLLTSVRFQQRLRRLDPALHGSVARFSMPRSPAGAADSRSALLLPVLECTSFHITVPVIQGTIAQTAARQARAKGERLPHKYAMEV